MVQNQDQPLQLPFRASLKVGLPGGRITSDGGLRLVRDLHDGLGFSELIEQHLTDSWGENTQLPLGDRLVKHARYYRLLLAESHLTRRLFGAMVRRIGLLSMPAG